MMHGRMKIYLICFLVLTSLSLCACDTSSALTVANVAYNRYDLQQKLENNYISIAAEEKIHKHRIFTETSHISASAFNYVVLLTGQTPNEQLKEKAQKLVETIPGVKRVINEIVIARPNSYFDRAKDSWITTKIRVALYASNKMSPNKVKVITENQVVYLMGVVDRREAKIITRIAKNTAQVKRVVKVFTYVNYSTV